MQVKSQLLFVIGCLLCVIAGAQPKSSVSTGEWTVLSENNEPGSVKDTTYLGKPCIKLDGHKTAVAIRKGKRHRNLRVECDIAGRVMSGIGFHVKDEQNYQFLYFRPGYGGTREAIQYVPIYNGALSWVLYNYPTYEKAADMQSLQWFHAAIEVRGSVMRVFVNYSAEPQMEINLVETDATDGEILLRSMFGETYFANITVTEPLQLLNNWQLSEQFPRKATLDLDPATKSNWKPVKTDAGNIVNIARYIPNPNGVVIARHALPSDTDREAVLYFDFIGKLKVYLNGKQLFYYEKAKLDRIFAGTERIVLRLNKGQNDLVFVSEGDATVFGNGFNAMGRMQHQNWGFVAELGMR